MTLEDQQQADQPDPKTEVDEAEALWAEFDTADKAAADAARKADDNPYDDGGEKAAADAKAEDAEWQEGDEGKGEEGDGAEAAPPAKGAKPDQQPPADTGEKPKTQQPDQADIWAGATDAQRDAWQNAQRMIQNFNHRLSSDSGRIAALQRKIDQLSAAAQAPQPKAADQAATQGKQPEAADQKAAKDAFASDGWKTLEEDYPEIASAIRGLVDPLMKDMGSFQEMRQAVEQDRHQQRLTQERMTMDRMEPGWDGFLRENSAAFTQWINGQPGYVREAFERNKATVVNAGEAADIVSRFRGHLNQQRPPEPAPPANAGQSNTPPMSERRSRQVQSATAIPRTAPPSKAGIPDDPQGAWDAFERMGL